MCAKVIYIENPSKYITFLNFSICCYFLTNISFYKNLPRHCNMFIGHYSDNFFDVSRIFVEYFKDKSSDIYENKRQSIFKKPFKLKLA